MHIPGPDRLTNDGYREARHQILWQSVRACRRRSSTARVTESLMGGPRGATAARKSYDVTHSRDEIDEALETEAPAALKLNVERKGDKIDIIAEVTKLKKPGENVKLRFVLIEEVVRYPGGNGQRLHHHVVRAMPGGADGFALKDEDREAERHGQPRRSAEVARRVHDQVQQGRRGPFVDDEHPLHLKKLKVVALIQDDDNKEILQAVQVDVPDAK